MGTHNNWMMTATWIDYDEECTGFCMWEVELRGAGWGNSTVLVASKQYILVDAYV